MNDTWKNQKQGINNKILKKGYILSRDSEVTLSVKPLVPVY
jgi:hypothetical protein